MEDPQNPRSGLPPEAPNGNVALTLEDRDLWMKFHEAGTEMVITKSGRRMFPQLKVRVTGLLSQEKYLILVDFVPVDNFRYKWNKDRWEVSGKAEAHHPFRTFVHPDSPALGLHWTKEIVCFQKLKLTNNTLDRQGHVVLHSMHRYQPRFHVLRADDFFGNGASSSSSPRWSAFRTFAFPETAFTSVTAYQNEKITALKIDHNPFAKGFRDEGRRGARERRLQRKRELTEEEAPNADAKDRGSMAEEEDRRPCRCHPPAWPSGRGSFHGSEQQYGADAPRAPSAPAYRFPDVPGAAGVHQGLATDVAAPFATDLWVRPESSAVSLEPGAAPFPPRHDYGGVGEAVVKPGAPLRRTAYDSYAAPEQPFGQWVVPPGAPYRTVGYAAFSHAEFGAAQAGSGHGPGGASASAAAEWGQWPLFPPYGRW